ncbi:MAG TPA: PEP/pyruvate-binding domain-containing protein [Jatrophihabitans sp.]|jgi:hypothetical protein|uniref:PEP/pyruvate-binding domain-containing protein n=1 Tax=Jatrophihabitans sp. TaxID=1932789 RepID=UPI002F2364ED
MTRLTDLAEATSPSLHGNKAAGLARVYGRVAVPAGLVAPGGWISACLGDEARAELDRLLREVTRRAEDDDQLLKQLAAMLDRIRLTASQARQLRAAVADLELGPVLMVRSSSADEDGTSLSFAGVFDSLINVEEQDLEQAVRKVWLSAFSPKALLQYRRIGRFPGCDRMSVLVQRAIQPVVAGVAFSEPSGDCYVEWTAGHGGDLVAGLSAPTGERLSSSSAAAPGWRQQLQASVKELSEGGSGQDVEWAWDGQVAWIVQVRPRTADLAGQSAAAGLRIAPLYEGDAHDLVLGQCADVYTRIRSKRRIARAIAISHGARVPGGWLANWDRRGSVEVLTAWSRQLPHRLVIDSSPTERQHIIDSSELADTVRTLAEASPEDGEFAFLCREYVQGDLALLSTVAADGSVYVESSEEGLLAVNRGLGSAHPMTLDALAALVGPDQARTLESTTYEHARRLHPRTALEWVVNEATLLFVDYSAPAAELTAPDNQSALSGSRVLSAGVASGLVQVLEIDDILTASSIAPIISIAQSISAENEALLLRQLRQRLSLADSGVIVAASRPIAVLSMLIGVVEGFLFEEGALLSHLGILLREAGVPAAIVGTGNLPHEGSFVQLVHGTVISSPDGRRLPAGS